MDLKQKNANLKPMTTQKSDGFPKTYLLQTQATQSVNCNKYKITSIKGQEKKDDIFLLVEQSS